MDRAQVLVTNGPTIGLVIPIVKSEPLPDGRLLVQGIASDETFDRQGEVVDYATCKAAFQEWNGQIPIHEQHDPLKAVGRGIEAIFDDEKRQIILKSFISKGAPDTQAKVLDGTLRFYSIRGAASKREAETIKGADGKDVTAIRTYIKSLSETSFVDTGANHSASISIVKSADGKLETVGLEGETPVPIIKTHEVEIDGQKLVIIEDPTLPADSRFAVQMVLKADVTPDITRFEFALAPAIDDVSKINAPKIKSEGGEFVVMDSDGHVYGKHATKAEAKKQLAALYVAKGKEAKKSAGVAKQGDGMEIVDAQMALNALVTCENMADAIRSLMAYETNEEHPEPPEQLAALAAALDGIEGACSKIRMFIASEIQEDESAKAATAAGDVQKGWKDMVTKDNAQSVHDHAKSMGADCVKKADAPASEDVIKSNEALVAKLDGLGQELTTMKAALEIRGKEAETLREQVTDLKAKVDGRIVEPGQPVYKGSDGKPTRDNPALAESQLVPAGKLEEIVTKHLNNPEGLSKAMSLLLAEIEVKKALTAAKG